MDRPELIDVLRTLDERLSSSFDVILIGGAAMILHFGASRATRDIDVLVLRGDLRELRRTVKAVAHQYGLPEDWMSDAAKGFADIAESTAHCRESGRLTWVVLDWLIHHIEQVDEQKLLRETCERGSLSVLGVLCDAARLQKQHPKFEWMIAACAPHEKIEPFFHRVARSPLASRLARENALDVFRRWNYLCSELRYL